MLTVLLLVTWAADVATCQHFCFSGTEELLGSAPEQCCTTAQFCGGMLDPLPGCVHDDLPAPVAKERLLEVLQREIVGSTGLQVP